MAYSVIYSHPLSSIYEPDMWPRPQPQPLGRAEASRPFWCGYHARVQRPSAVVVMLLRLLAMYALLVTVAGEGCLTASASGSDVLVDEAGASLLVSAAGCITTMSGVSSSPFIFLF